MEAKRPHSYPPLKPKPYFKYTQFLTASRSKFLHHGYALQEFIRMQYHFDYVASKELFTVF